MTVEEVQAQAKLLAGNIQAQVAQFEKQTGVFVHSIPITRHSVKVPASVDVKVSLTPPRL